MKPSNVISTTERSSLSLGMVFDSVLTKLRNLKNWQAAVVLALLGIAVFSASLGNPFEGDDNYQVINNPVVHSLANLNLLFDGGTFYSGGGIAPLTGTYYRPLMSFVFSLIYSLFQLHAIYYHIFQLLVYIGSAVLLFLFFRYSFSLLLSLALAMIFLVHPLNSQVVFAIPSMQDALYFFFGILALWLLLRFNSVKSLAAVAICLLLALLSKETGGLFSILALLYLSVFDRKRLRSFIGMLVPLLCIYLVMKIHAVGLDTPVKIAPIDSLPLAGRLMTAPSAILFYFQKLLFPTNLASSYYWVYRTFSVQHVLLPMIIIFSVVAIFIFLGHLVQKNAPKAQFLTYIFFSAWATIGLIPCLQIVPLDMTACTTWFYFSMAGLFGMIGTLVVALGRHVKPSMALGVPVVIIVLLGGYTAYIGTYWGSDLSLYRHDAQASPGDYYADNDAATALINQSQYAEAEYFATRSIELYPTLYSYYNLGLAYEKAGNLPKAYSAFFNALRYGQNITLDEKLSELSLVYGNPSVNEQLIVEGIKNYPQDGVLWEDLAVEDAKTGNIADAKSAANNAIDLGGVSDEICSDIVNDKPFTLYLPDLKQSVEIP
jgi:protein O-mannosyl-transferase